MSMRKPERQRLWLVNLKSGSILTKRAIFPYVRKGNV